MTHQLHEALDDFESCVQRMSNNISCFLIKVNEVDCAIDVIKSLLVAMEQIGQEQVGIRVLAIEPSLSQLKSEMSRLVSVVEEGILRILGLAGLLADEVRQQLLLLGSIVGDISPVSTRMKTLSISLNEMEALCATILYRSSKQLTTLGLIKFRA
ncbi:hypothetical protein PS3A_47920 [Pseudomonas sp. 3A(2025)]